MIISHTNKYIFIKSAKTAGTSVEAVLSNFCTGNDIVTPLGNFTFNQDKEGQWIHHTMNAGDFQQHDWGVTIKKKVGAEIWDNYFKFSIARNPWERVVSLFSWLSRNNPALKPSRRFYHRIGFPFDEFRESKKLFNNFVKNGDWETNDRFYLINGELCADFIIRYEKLADDFKEVCKRVGLEEITLPRLKSGFRKSYHYSQYYDGESRAIVAERHKNDIRLFNYQFETG